MKTFKDKNDNGHKSVSVESKPSPGGYLVDPLIQHQGDWLAPLRERIKPDELAKLGFPRPKEVQLFEGNDSDGDEAFFVYLIFPNKTAEAVFAWKKIEPMVSWVRDLIWTETGERRYPYVMVKRQREMPGGRH